MVFLLKYANLYFFIALICIYSACDAINQNDYTAIIKYLNFVLDLHFYIHKKLLRLHLSVVIFLFVLRNQWLQYFQYWELNTASVGARGRERCCTFHYLSWTDSIKSAIFISSFWFGFVSKDVFLPKVFICKSYMSDLKCWKVFH